MGLKMLLKVSNSSWFTKRSVYEIRESHHTKKLYAYKRTESAHTKYKVNKGVLQHRKTSAHMCNTL